MHVNVFIVPSYDLQNERQPLRPSDRREIDGAAPAQQVPSHRPALLTSSQSVTDSSADTCRSDSQSPNHIRQSGGDTMQQLHSADDGGGACFLHVFDARITETLRWSAADGYTLVNTCTQQ